MDVLFSDVEAWNLVPPEILSIVRDDAQTMAPEIFRSDPVFNMFLLIQDIIYGDLLGFGAKGQSTTQNDFDVLCFLLGGLIGGSGTHSFVHDNKNRVPRLREIAFGILKGGHNGQ